jgi:hypothetical protein
MCVLYIFVNYNGSKILIILSKCEKVNKERLVIRLVFIIKKSLTVLIFNRYTPLLNNHGCH